MNDYSFHQTHCASQKILLLGGTVKPLAAAANRLLVCSAFARISIPGGKAALLH
jgi:hypothetical protein